MHLFAALQAAQRVGSSAFEEHVELDNSMWLHACNQAGAVVQLARPPWQDRQSSCRHSRQRTRIRWAADYCCSSMLLQRSGPSSRHEQALHIQAPSGCITGSPEGQLKAVSSVVDLKPAGRRRCMALAMCRHPADRRPAAFRVLQLVSLAQLGMLGPTQRQPSPCCQPRRHLSQDTLTVQPAWA